MGNSSNGGDERLEGDGPGMIQPQEALNLIKKKRDEEGKNWAEIANELERLGYKSPKTHKPISAYTARSLYFTKQVPKFYTPKKVERAPRSFRNETLRDVNRVLDMEGISEEKKVKIIKDLLG